MSDEAWEREPAAWIASQDDEIERLQAENDALKAALDVLVVCQKCGALAAAGTPTPKAETP